MAAPVMPGDGEFEHGLAERPERATMGILAADRILPVPVVAHEIAEPPGFRIERMLQEAEIAVRQPVE